MDTKPESFVVTYKNETHIVERHFELPNGDFIAYRRSIKGIEGIESPSLIDLHRATADMVIRHLLQFLPEDYGSANPYRPGQKL